MYEIIYNISYSVPVNLAKDWQAWMLEQHIPEIMSTNCFTNYQWVKLLDMDETEAYTFAIQFYAANNQYLQKYLQEYAPLLRKKAGDKWGNAIVGFRTTMQVIAKG